MILRCQVASRSRALRPKRKKLAAARVLKEQEVLYEFGDYGPKGEGEEAPSVVREARNLSVHEADWEGPQKESAERWKPAKEK